MVIFQNPNGWMIATLIKWLEMENGRKNIHTGSRIRMFFLPDRSEFSQIPRCSNVQCVAKVNVRNQSRLETQSVHILHTQRRPLPRVFVSQSSLALHDVVCTMYASLVVHTGISFCNLTHAIHVWKFLSWLTVCTRRKKHKRNIIILFTTSHHHQPYCS